MSGRFNHNMLLVVSQVCLWLLPFLAVRAEEEGPGLEEEFAAISTLEHDELEEEFELLEEQATVYSASKHEQHLSDSPSAVTVITRKQIERSFCSSVSCLLEFVPEVNVRRLQPMHTQVGVRVYTGEHMLLVLVDGRDVTSEILGVPQWEGLTVHLEDIERIEVIRGPGSALYGANAYAAVVSIFTRLPEKTGGRFLMGLGENGAANLYLSLSLPRKTWGMAFSASHEEHGGWEDPRKNEMKISRIYGRAHADLGKSKLDLVAGYFQLSGETGSWTFPVVMNYARQAYMSGALRAGPWNSRLSMSVGDLNFVLDAPLQYRGMTLGYFPEELNATEVSADGEQQLSLDPWQDNLLIVGANARWTSTLCKDVVEKEEHQFRVGVYLHDEQRLFDSLLMTLGLRLDYNSVSSFSLSPRIALGWAMTSEQNLRIQFSQAFHKPSFLNSSFNLTSIREEITGIDDFFRRSIGTKNLKNEQLNSLELGYLGRFLAGRLGLEATLYYQQCRDTITLFWYLAQSSFGTPDLSKSVLEYRNTGRYLDGLGGSLSINMEPTNFLRFSASYSYRYTYYAADPAEHAWLEAGRRGERVPWEPVHLAKFSGSYLLKDKFKLNLGISYFSETTPLWSQDGGVFSTTVPYQMPAVCVVDVSTSWFLATPIGKVEAGVSIFDLFNAQFRYFPAAVREDGKIVGGERLGRELLLFLRSEF